MDLPATLLVEVLEGVAVAAFPAQANSKEDGALIKGIADWLLSCGTQQSSFADWRSAIQANFDKGEEGGQQLANIALAVGFLRQASRENLTVTPTELDAVWDLIYEALAGTLTHRRQFFSASRSAQGFLAVPLCSLVRDGNIDQLFRLHVWLPDGKRGNPDFALHSHQPFAQSWVLAGEGHDHSYKVEPCTADPAGATHAEYAIGWKDSGSKADEEGASYKTHQSYSIVRNTEKLVCLTPLRTSLHTRNMSYTIPAAQVHRTEVTPDVLHATLFFFDSRRGFEKHAPVLGPKDGRSFKQLRDPGGFTPTEIAKLVHSLRKWEASIAEGKQYAKKSELEEALRAFGIALHLCEATDCFPNPPLYRHLTLRELGNMNRRFGRYQQAREDLEAALAIIPPSLRSAETSGELGVVYRHMNLLENAKVAFETQYSTSRELNFERGSCRAVGNLGMVNYQLYQQTGDPSLLELAIRQLEERTESARRLQESVETEFADADTKAHWRSFATTWESIGHARLSLCYASQGKTKEAIASALKSLNHAISLEDPVVIAFSRFFFGRALLLDGQKDEAMSQFNPPGTCTPAMALCKEPSDEHRQYLKELVDAGADMELVDEQGYTALEYAVFNGDAASEALVLEGLRRKLSGHPNIEIELGNLKAGARLRKGYRELFQDKLRPVLLNGDQSDGLRTLRLAYAAALAQDPETRRHFDELKFLPYTEFLEFGRLPRSSDGLATPFLSPAGVESSTKFVIFFSYRWINTDKTSNTPDDSNNTQYRRMISATEAFLKLHPDVDRNTLGLWVDHACVDQDNPMAGVNALPIIIAQCNAVISLVSDDYYSRAWCSVEVMMVQTLRKSYNLHLWYEHVPQDPEGQVVGGTLREGPIGLEIVMAEKFLTFEDDRPKVLFLEKQSKLLG
ncbi:Tetratricopeptide repeat protein 28 [Cladorrhinum samala]|uniref:Tetratricopeptide repeat protein 28 n=1 Tax=Cladorrhinum samala TaxID=585594 RepID=A0AAV9HL73_9PEZI|nr:Tetratricopeptide repeat protein 28 [Cladorrhinum samala]